MQSSWVADSVGDVEAARLGGTDPYKVPNYWRHGGGRVLGLDEGLRISLEVTSKLGIQITPGGRAPTRYTDGESALKLHKGGIRRVVIGKQKEYGEPAAFIQVGSGHQGKEDDLWIGHQFADTASSKNDDSREELDSISDEEKGEGEGEESPLALLRTRASELDRQVRANPKDIQSWLTLASLQAEIFQTSGNTQSIAEVQLAVLTRAKAAHIDNRHSSALALARLRLVSEKGLASDEFALDREWRETLWEADKQANGVDSLKPFLQLYQAYIDFRESDFSNFNLTEIQSLFASAMKRIVDMTYEHDEEKVTELLESTAIDLQRRACLVLTEAGYHEQVRGILQAQCELSFRCPQTLTTENREGFSCTLNALEDFWDLELPRFGEEGAKGFDHFYNDKVSVKAKLQALQKDASTTIDFSAMPAGLRDSDAIIRWLTLERARGRLRRGPSRMDDEPDWTTGESEVDPYSHVFFPDVKGFVLPFRSERVQRNLIDLYLCHIGLPSGLIHPSGFRDNPRSHYHLVAAEDFWPRHLSTQQSEARALTMEPSWDVIGGEVMEREKRSGLRKPFDNPIRSWPLQGGSIISTSTIETVDWFGMLKGVKVTREQAKEAKNFLEMIAIPSLQTEVHLLGIEFTALSQGHKAAVKMARRILASDRNNLALWNAFAHLESGNGNADSARLVYRSALEQDSVGSDGHALLWRSWAELEWKQRSKEQCLWVVSLAARSFFSAKKVVLDQPADLAPSELLRTRRYFTQAKEKISQGSEEFCRSACFCAMLFEYFSRSSEDALPSAMGVQKESLSALSSCRSLTSLQEVMTMDMCHLVWYHVEFQGSRGYRPIEIRDIFAKAVETYPNNSTFWSLLAAFEMRAKVENFFRSTIEKVIVDVTKKNAMESEGRTREEGMKAENAWLFAIYAELHVNTYRCNVSAIRNLFERALSDERTSSSVLLWRQYVKFEICIATQSMKHGERYKEEEANGNEMEKDIARRHRKQEKRTRSTALQRTSRLLYRAIRHCPYSRELYLAAFSPPLRHILTHSELLSLASMMEEKHIRTFSNLTRFLQEATRRDEASSSSSNSSGGGGEDEEGESWMRE